MKPYKFNPADSMPVCDVCGAMCTKMVMDPKNSADTIGISLTFACGASWCSHRRGQFKTDIFPNGPFEASDTYWATWTEDVACSNAVEVARKQREKIHELDARIVNLEDVE